MAPPNTTEDSRSKDPDPFKSMLSKLEKLKEALAFTDVANDIPQLDSVTLKSLVTSLKKNHENNTLSKLENDSREVSSHEITDSDLTDSAVNTKGFSLQSCEVRYDNENKQYTLLLKMKEAHNNPVTIQLYTGSHPKRISERMKQMTEDQASQVIRDDSKKHLLNQMEAMLKDIKEIHDESDEDTIKMRNMPEDIESEEESNEDTIKYVSLDYMEEKYRALLKEKNQILLDLALNTFFYKDLYVVLPGKPEGFKDRIKWACNVTFQESLRDTLASSLIKNGEELEKLELDPKPLFKKLPHMKAILVTIDKLQKNNMIHGEGAKKLELLRQYLQGKYDKWKENLLENLDKDSRSPDKKKSYMEKVLVTIDKLLRINSERGDDDDEQLASLKKGDDEQLASLKKGVQGKYDKWKAESTNSPNHHHHPQLNEFTAKIKDGKSLAENRYDKLHQTVSLQQSNDPSLSQKKSQNGR